MINIFIVASTLFSSFFYTSYAFSTNYELCYSHETLVKSCKNINFNVNDYRCPKV